MILVVKFRQIWIILLVQIILHVLQGETYQNSSQEADNISTWDNMKRKYCYSLYTKFGYKSIYWPKLEYGFGYSSPVCLDELKFPKYRNFNNDCMNTKLLKCSYIQSETTSGACPNGESILFIKDKHKLCFSNSTKYATRWDYTHCLRYGTKILDYFDYSKDHYKKLFNHIKNKLAKLNTIFWLPIRRENSYSPLQYYLPFMWKNYVIPIQQITGTGNCLAIHFLNEEFTLLLEDCDHEYPFLCAYDAFVHRKINCSDDSYVLYSHPNTTKYAYVQNGLGCAFGQISKANSTEITKMYQTLLGENYCAVDVFPNKKTNYDPQPSGTSYYSSEAPCGRNCALNITNWTTRYREVDYINWNVANIGYGNEIVIDSTGSWMLYNHPKCTVCEDTIESSTQPTITLESNHDNRLTLTISVNHLILSENVKRDSFDNLCNFKDLLGINCFAQYDNIQFENFDMKELVERNFNTYSSVNILTVIDIIGISYNEVYSIEVNKSGRFWCEGYSIVHNLVISSDELYVKVIEDTENFAVIMKMIGEFADDFNQNQVGHISRDLQEMVISALGDYRNTLSSVQIKIVTVDYTKGEMMALVHFEMRKDLDDDGSGDDNDDDDGDDQIELLLMYKNLLWEAMETLNETQFTFYSINHTQFCLPEVSLVNGIVFDWGSGELNEFVTTKNFDLEENGSPIIRQCLGDNLYGVKWFIVNELNGGAILTPGPVTKELFNLERRIAIQSNESLEVLKNISSIMALNVIQLIPADLFTISKVLSYLDAYDFHQYMRSDNYDGMSDIIAIIDSCTQVNYTVIQASHIVNTTNRILYSFEIAISNIGGALKRRRSRHVLKTSNVMVVVLNPGSNNISGISVYKNLTKTELNNDISDYYVEYILANASITTFDEGFTIASFVPQNLLNNLLVINPKLQVIITLFYNDALYQDETHGDQLDSIIISVTIPGISSRLPGFMPFYFTSRSNSIYTLTSNMSTNHNNYCSYWDFQPKNKTLKSQWSQDGCHFMGLLTSTSNETQISACACEHLTSFAFLVGDMDVSKVSDSTNTYKPTAHDQALDIITLLGCSLSILGVLGIFITALVFPVWRRKSGILLQFSGAIALQMILTLCVTTNLIDFEVRADIKWTMCITTGATIQYSLLVVFSWTLISAYLQFKRYVSVFNSKPSNLYLKTFVVGWLMPLIPVLLGVLISPESYRKSLKNSFNVCYPMQDFALYFTVLLPIGLIVLANFTIFIFVLRNIFQLSSNKYHTNEKDLILSQLRLSVFLFFLLGLSWSFGLANAMGFGLIFSYLFCITATVQGLVLFIYFVLMDPDTRMTWYNLLSCKSRRYFDRKMHT